MADPNLPPPPLPPPPAEVEGTERPSEKTPLWKRWWVIVLAVVVVVAVVASIFAPGDQEADDVSDVVTTDALDDREAPEVTEPDTPEADEIAGEPVESTDVPISDEPADQPEETAAPTTTEAPAPPARDVVEGAPDGEQGDRANPVPVGVIADVGDGWRLQVLDVIEDGTEQVLADNMFNDPPPEGSRFTLVTVALGYFGFDDPESPFVTSISAVGSANRQLDENCGVVPSSLPFFEDFFAGGVVTGNVCFVTEPADAGALQLYSRAGFTGTDVFLDASAAPEGVTVMSPLRGAQDGSASAESRRNAIPLGAAVDVGDEWTFTVTTAASDITDAVLAENMFNTEPPEGSRFVGVGVDFAYGGEGSGNAFSVTVKAVADSNIQLDAMCGVIPDGLDQFADVFDGGSATGNLCFVVPADEIDSIIIYASEMFGSEMQFFATR